MVLKSVRLPEDLAQEVDELKGDRKLTSVVREALTYWVRLARRRREDEAIARAMAQTSAEQRNEEDRLLALAEKSSLEVLEDLDGGSAAG